MGAIRRENPPSTHIITTLYDLIEAISDEVQPGEESLLTDVVLHLLDSGKIKCYGNLKVRRKIQRDNLNYGNVKR